MIGFEFLRHRNRFLARVRRRYFSTEPSDCRKYVCVGRLLRGGGVLLNYQLVMNLLLKKVSNSHMLKTRPPNLHRFDPSKGPAKVSNHSHI